MFVPSSNAELHSKLERINFCKENGLAEEVRFLYRPREELIYGISRKTKHRHDIRGYVDQISQQATPIQVCQHTILVFCGLQTTKTSIDEGRGFFDGSTMSAHLSRMMLEVLATWENETFQIHFKDLQPILSFNNLYHWTGSEIINNGTSIVSLPQMSILYNCRTNIARICSTNGIRLFNRLLL